MASDFKVKITNIKKIITGDTQEKYQITFKGDFSFNQNGKLEITKVEKIKR